MWSQGAVAQGPWGRKTAQLRWQLLPRLRTLIPHDPAATLLGPPTPADGCLAKPRYSRCGREATEAPLGRRVGSQTRRRSGRCKTARRESSEVTKRHERTSNAMASEESRSEGPRTERFWERHSHGDREKIAVAGAGARGAPGGDAVWVAP